MRGRVEFDDVTFSYDPDRPLIEDLSLVAEPGQTIAIVGPTGAGKTTLVNLIMRFYELERRRITLDGRDIASMPRDELRSNIGMVLQDTWLFGGTIRDNIAYGNPDATEEQILEAARATYVDRFVHSLPDGYDTLINEEGDNISAGEKQLLTIARAFLADPAILILDEATSSVDTRTEVLIQEAMNRAAQRPHQLRDRAPPVDDPRRRRDPRDGERPHRRAGLARRAPRPRRRRTTGCTTRSSPRRSSTSTKMKPRRGPDSPRQPSRHPHHSATRMTPPPASLRHPHRSHRAHCRLSHRSQWPATQTTTRSASVSAEPPYPLVL